MLSGDVNIRRSSVGLSIDSGGDKSCSFRCFRFSKLLRLRLFLPRAFLLLLSGLNVGDSSSSSTMIRRLRSLAALVDGVLIIGVMSSVIWTGGESMSIHWLSFNSGDSFMAAVNVATARGGVTAVEAVSGHTPNKQTIK